MNTEPKFWKVAIKESIMCGQEINLVTNVYFQEAEHKNAREYVDRMSKHVDNPDNWTEYCWIIEDPELVDSLEDSSYTSFNGHNALKHIRDLQEKS